MAGERRTRPTEVECTVSGTTRLTKLATVAAFVVAVAFSASAPAAPEDDVAAVTRQWNDAFAKHDLEKILSFYAKDATVWGTNALTLRTTPGEVRSFFQSTFRIPNVKIRFDNQTIRVFGNVAVVAGNYTFIAGSSNDEQTSSARYSFTFLKTGDRWLIIDHHSSPMPSPRGARRT
jgi:uncharacterized protein (TIGR02246 family)